MAEVIDGVASVIEQLNERVLELERRVSELEIHPAKPILVKPAVAATRAAQKVPATFNGFPVPRSSGGVVSTIGKAVLGFSGAYLLRAIAESSSVPKLPVLLVAIVYACLWIYWAVRKHGINDFTSITCAVTSVLILSPLLWESTVRFQILSPAFTGAVLVGFVVFALTLSWHRKLEVIPWIAMLAAVMTALALIVATHALVPLTTTLLAVALCTELAVCFGLDLSMRVVPAFAANLAVLLLVVLMASSDGLPEGYTAASTFTLSALSLALLAIYAGSVGVRTFVLGRRITIFDFVQSVPAFAITYYGAVRVSHGALAPALQVSFLILAQACYWGVFTRFMKEPDRRNYRVLATWAAALLIAGSFLLASVHLQAPFLCVVAVLAAVLYKRTAIITLGVQSSFFLAAAAVVSPLAGYIFNAFAKSVPTAPGFSVWSIALASVVCYTTSLRGPADDGNRRFLWIIPAVLAAFTITSIVVAGIVWLAAGYLEPAASRLSVIRTIVICALAITLGFLGLRWKRKELNWISYGAVGFGTLKLVFEDLRYGNPASLVVSFLFYGMILILLPRLTYRSQVEPDAVASAARSGE
jgi:hypothetical protein